MYATKTITIYLCAIKLWTTLFTQLWRNFKRIFDPRWSHVSKIKSVTEDCSLLSIRLGLQNQRMYYIWRPAS